eukprot:scaffold12993_cov96-Isochrysis_galbana.AAC.1
MLLLWPVAVAVLRPGVGGVPELPSSSFGAALAPLGPQLLAVGAPTAAGGGEQRGAVVLLSLAGYTVDTAADASSTILSFDVSLPDFAGFGSALAALPPPAAAPTGALPTLAVGAPAFAGAAGPGSVHLLELSPTTLSVTSSAVLVPGQFRLGLDSMPLPQLQPGDRFGCALAVLPDLDGDGGADLAVSACGVDHGPEATIRQGDVFLLSLSPSRGLVSRRRLQPSITAYTFGVSIAALAGANAFAPAALAVGGRQTAQGDGTAWLVQLAPGGIVSSISTITAGAAGASDLGWPAGFAESSLSLLPDADHDGIPELAAGATG